jgi:ubiquitin C-terminal hydrolase
VRTRPTKVFQGKMLTRITCRGCGSVSTRSQEYYDLSLPVPAVDPAAAARCSADTREEGLHGEAGSAQGPGEAAHGETAPEVRMRQMHEGSRAGLLTVQQLLQAVLEGEELTGAEQYACDKCPVKQDALRQVVPPSLVPCVCIITCRIWCMCVCCAWSGVGEGRNRAKGTGVTDVSHVCE